jgi:hypothetical protein
MWQPLGTPGHIYADGFAVGIDLCCFFYICSVFSVSIHFDSISNQKIWDYAEI